MRETQTDRERQRRTDREIDRDRGRFVFKQKAEPHSSVGSVQDLRRGGRWFDPWLGQYYFRGLMIVTATGVIPLSRLSIVLTMVIWESSQWLGRNIVRSTVKKILQESMVAVI